MNGKKSQCIQQVNLFTRIALIFLISQILVLRSYALNDAPQTFTLDGELFQVGGSALLLDPSVKITVQVLDPTAHCLLYEEQQTVNTRDSGGYFHINVGSATGSGKRTVNDPGRTMAQVFQNTAGISANNVPGQTCAGGTYTPTAGAVRYFRLTVTPSTTGTADVLTPDIIMDSVPNAMVAQSVQGLEKSNILQVTNTGAIALTQGNLEALFTTPAYTNLQSILAGNFIKTDSSGAALPSYTSDPAGAANGEIWFDSTTGQIKYQTSGGVQVVGAAGSGTISSLTVGSSMSMNGTVAGTISNGSGTIDLSNTGIVAGTYTKLTVDAKGRATAGTVSLVEADIPNLTTAGKVSGNTITSGTISGSAGVNTTGNLITTGTVSGLNVQATNLRVYNGANYVQVTAGAISGNVNFTLPTGAGSNGQILSTDGNGVMSWINPTVIGSLGGDVSGALGSNTVQKIQGKSITAGSVSGQVMIYDGTQWVNSVVSGDATLSYAGVLSLNKVPVSKGGTNTTSYGNNHIIVSNGTGSALTDVTCSLNQVLSFDASGYVTCANVSSLSGAIINGGNTTGADISIGTNDNKALAFKVNNATAMTISQSGYVGIGNTTPAYPLDVKSTATSNIANFTGSNDSVVTITSGGGWGRRSVLNFNATGASSSWFVLNGSGGDEQKLYFISGNNINNTPGIVFDPNGRIGIGTTSPGTALDVSGAITAEGMSAAPSVSTAGTGRLYYDYSSNKFKVSQNGGAYVDLISAASTTGFLNGGNAFGGSASLGTTDNNSLSFLTNNTTAMTISQSGYVGIGTTSPSGIFQVAGGTAAAATNGTNITLTAQSAGTGNQNGGSIVLNSGAATGTGSPGSVGINATPSGSYTLYAINKGSAQRFTGFEYADTSNVEGVLILTKSKSGGVTSSDALGSISFNGRDSAGTGNTGATITSKVDGTPTTGQTPGNLIFLTTPNGSGSNVERMRITNAGNVGIGTNAPSSALDVSGALTAEGIAAPSTSATNTGRIYYDYSANKFKVSQNGGAYVDLISAASTTGFLNGGNAFGGTATLGTTDNNPLKFITNNVTAMTISQNGYVGIGTSQPAATLDIPPTMTSVTSNDSAIYTHASYTPPSAPAINVYPSAISATLSSSSSNVNSLVLMTGVSGSVYATTPSGVTYGTTHGGAFTSVNQGAGTINVARGSTSQVNNTSTGTITSAFAVDATIQNTSTGTIAGAAAIRANASVNSGGGTINNLYGVKIDKQNGTGITNAWGLYQYDSGDKNYFAGNVGFGIMSPSTALDISGAVTYQAMASAPAVSNSNSGRIYYDSSANKFKVSQNGGAYVDLVNSSTSTFNNGGNAFGASASLGTTDNNSLSIKTNNTTAMTISQNGYVGIGTTSPGYPVDVNTALNANQIFASNTNNTYAHTGLSVNHSDGPSYSGTIVAVNHAGGDTVGAFQAAVANAPTSQSRYALVAMSRPNSDWYATTSAHVNGDFLAGIGFAGQSDTNVGTGMKMTASIIPQIDGTVSSAVLPTSLTFRTSATDGTGLTERMRITSSGNVGIGTSTPRTALDVSGAMALNPATLDSTSTIDGSTGNTHYTTSSCGSFQFNNLKDGATYMFVVQGATAATCTFTAYSDAGSHALTVHMPPDNGATTANKHTIFNLTVVGTHVYVAWTPGY